MTTALPMSSKSENSGHAKMSSAMAVTPLQPIFIPIDVSNQRQRAVFQTQRVICGWKYENQVIDMLFRQASQGDRFLFWVCIPLANALGQQTTSAGGDIGQSSSSSTSSPTVQKAQTLHHTAIPDKALVVSKYGSQILGLQSMSRSSSSTLDAGDDGNDSTIALPLLLHSPPPGDNPRGDGSRDNINNATRADSSNICVPIGHISLDLKDLEPRPAPLLGNGDGSTIAITTLFILPAYRKLGVGTTAMQHAEDMIRAGDVSFTTTTCSVPSQSDELQGENTLGTKMTQEAKHAAHKLHRCATIALTTLAERHWVLDAPDGKHMWVRMGGVDVAMPKQDVKVRYHGPWYTKLGYSKITEMPKFATDIDQDGKGEYNLWWAEVWTKKL